MGAIPVTCYNVCATGPWLPSGEPAPARPVHGHSSLSGKLCTSMSSPWPQLLSGKLATEWASPQSVAPPGHIHWFQGSWVHSLGTFNGVSSSQAARESLLWHLRHLFLRWCSQCCPSLLSRHTSPAEQHFALCRGLTEVSSAWLPGTALRSY